MAGMTKPALSKEFVGNSDDSDDQDPAKKVKANTYTKPAPAISWLSAPKVPKVTSSTNARTSPKPLPPIQIVESKPLKEGASDEGSETGDASNSESHDSFSSADESPRPSKAKSAAARLALPKGTPAPQVNGKSKISTLQATEELDGNDSEEHTESNNDDGSESGSRSGSESESDETSVEDSARKTSPKKDAAPQQKLPQYELPPGFKEASIAIAPSSKAAEIFAPENLHGKQIWHITAPASVPISLLKDVSHRIEDGAFLAFDEVSYKGADYGLAVENGDATAKGKAVLLPSHKRNDYQSAPVPVSKTIHLQQNMKLPSHTRGPPALPDALTSATVARKKPQEQPQGLRMRYRPFGASEDSNVDRSPAPHFRIPQSIEPTSRSRNRKQNELGDLYHNTDDDAKASPVKSKKRKEHAIPALVPSNGSQSVIEESPSTESKKQKKESQMISESGAPSRVKRTQEKDKENEKALPVNTRSTDDKSPQKETIELRRKRKEGKRRRKELQLQRVQDAEKEDTQMADVPPVEEQDAQVGAVEGGKAEVKEQMQDHDIQLPAQRQSSPRKEMKDDRAERREERRRRRREREGA